MIPAGVNETQIFYQQTAVTAAFFPDERFLIPWGEVPAAGAAQNIAYYNMSSLVPSHEAVPDLLSWGRCSLACDGRTATACSFARAAVPDEWGSCTRRWTSRLQVRVWPSQGRRGSGLRRGSLAAWLLGAQSDAQAPAVPRGGRPDQPDGQIHRQAERQDDTRGRCADFPGTVAALLGCSCFRRLGPQSKAGLAGSGKSRVRT